MNESSIVQINCNQILHVHVLHGPRTRNIIILACFGPRTKWRKKWMKIILFDEQNLIKGDVAKLESIKISASNKVIPDLSLADVITTVENLTLDKVNNFVPRQLHSSQKTGRAYFEKKTGRVHSKYRK